MTRLASRAPVLVLACALAAGAAGALAAGARAQAPSPSAVPAPPAAPPAAPAPTPPGARLLSSIRNKLSAADLRSAESLAEVYRETYGDDGSHLLGVSWLARGALLLGEDAKAAAYVAETRRRTDARIARGVQVDQDDSLEIALGAAIEVEAQLRARSKGRADAVRFLDAEFARTPAPVALRSRIMKRRNLLALEGKPAPAWTADDHAGAPPPTLASLRGRPVLVYVWDKGCGDCRAFAPTLSRVAARHAAAGLAVVPITRYYVKEDHPREKARLDSTWAADYRPLGPASIVIGDAAMEAYGGSSTPTLVFIDRKGIVRRYTPTRLTEQELEKAIALALR
jgi:thiol-disulfide isomerase/thioredoxin